MQPPRISLDTHSRANPRCSSVNPEDEIYKNLESSPEAEIAGVVGPRGAAVGRGSTGTFWTITASLAAWRLPGQAMQKTPLTIRRKVEQAETSTYKAALKPYDVIRARVRLAAHSGSGARQALALELPGSEDADAELLAYARELQAPVTFEDEQFGTFTLNKRINQFRATAQWLGSPVHLVTAAADAQDLAKALAVARRLWANQDDWQRRVGEYAVQELLALKNDSWLNEDESAVTPEQFIARMKTETIDVGPYGFEFWHTDGGMFGGHSIYVRGGIDEGPDAASIEG